MARCRRQTIARWPQFRINSSQDNCRCRRGGCSFQFLMVCTLFAVLTSRAAAANYVQNPVIFQTQQASENPYVAGSHLLAWWGQRGDVESAIAQLDGVQQCSEGINVRVETELLEHDMAHSCRREAAGYDVKELLQPSMTLVTPTEDQTTNLCRSEACASWLRLAIEAAWLPDCRYRQSQMSFRSLAETLLRIREDLVVAGSGDATAPNGTLFREFYHLNQLANLMSTKEDVLNEVGSPVLLVARQLTEQEDFSLMGSGDSPPLSASVEPPGSTSGSARALSSGSSSNNPSSSNSASASASSGTVSSSSSSSNSNSVGDYTSGSDFNSSDTAGFTSSGVGPHASSTATTKELTPSYAYIVGAWVLFNGSYFFLMRRK
ncbi:hypothetical protein PHMEG_00013333 [Phytophthora megakarya]|uniref:Elicitin n=1 Tax=Phytophthora megakarya TaxID=4795 RepID=A0A225W7I0_9STRA|nr:hypothetical protein PHMEG_00013333 [Phytophthora megakarya]